MKNNRLKIFVLILAAPIVAVIILILIRPKSSNKSVVPVSPLKPKLSSQDETIQNDFNITLEIGNNDISFPEKAAIYRVLSSKLIESQSVDISKNLGLEGKTLEFDDTLRGKVLLIVGEDDSLIIAPEAGVIEYRIDPNINSLGQFPSDEELVSKAWDLLTKVDLFTYENLIFSSIKYTHLVEEGVETVDKEQANIATLYFKNTLDGIDVVGNQYENGTVYVQIDKDGIAYALFADLLPVVEKTIEVRIKSFDEIKNSLNDAEAQKLGDILILDTFPGFIKEVKIDQIKLAYLNEYGIGQEYIQPIFVLTGKATTMDNKSVDAVFYMPAVSQ